MADIQTYLDDIGSKVYGKDVRQAIIDAINQCYADAAAGITPGITTSAITGGTRVTVTVGSESTHFDVMNGQNGEDGTATDAQVAAWLDNHPEATTTVADGAISTAKLADGAVTQAKLDPTLELGVADNTITTQKIVDHAVTMSKTDFYYKSSLAYSPSWLSYRTSNGIRYGIAISDANLPTAVDEFPDVLYMCAPKSEQYLNAGKCRFLNRTSSGGQKYHDATLTSGTFNVTGYTQAFQWRSVTKEDFISAYNQYVTDRETTATHSGLTWDLFANTSGCLENVVMLTIQPTASLAEVGYTRDVISTDFATAVNKALESGEGTSSDEELARIRLSGKVMICLGDSYTDYMTSRLNSLASTFEMVCDNRGIVSSSIAGTTTGTKGFRPFWNRSDAIISDYANGYVINETTYTADDVGIITFMGGANDGFGKETWIGTGIHETDTGTIYGSCGHIFSTLAEAFPNAKVICITQPSNYNRSTSSITDDATAQTLGFDNLAELQSMTDVQFANYAMAVKEEAVYKSAWSYGWSIIDMFNEFPTMLSPANRSKYWSSDKIHLTGDGYTLIVKALKKRIIELVV